MKYTNYSLFSTEHRTLGLERALDRTLELGFDSVEHIENAVPTDASYKLKALSDAKDMRRELDARGLTVGCYSLVLNLLYDNVDGQVERAYRDIEYAHTIGSPFFHHTVIHAYDKTAFSYSLNEAFEMVAENLERIARRCNEYGITCLYEPQGLYFNGIVGMRKILSEMKARGLNVGVCGDTANSLYVNCMPIDIYKEFRDDIKHVHVKDFLYFKPAELEIVPEGGFFKNRFGNLLRGTILGHGVVPVIECIRLLRQSGYDEGFTLEFEGAEDNLPAIEASYAYMRKLAALPLERA